MSSMKQDFDVEQFESKLENLKDTQDGIQQMSSWCLQQRAHHKKIVASWLNVFKKVRVEHRLVLFYLANDVIQYSKRKRYEFVESWATALQRATTMVRDDKVRNKIFRIFKIWEQRGIYSEEYLSDLSGLLSMNPSKKSQATTSAEVNPEEFQVAKVAESASHRANDFSFQSATLISNIRDCVELSSVTDKSFKNLPKAPNCDIENIKTALKDKSHSDDVEKELDRYVTNVDTHRKHLSAEIRSRKAVVASLEAAIAFYSTQRGEVKVVVSAYKNFGSRIKLVKKKLDEITPNLPSPIPSPDINAPSPEPDSDSNLPDEQNPSMLIFKNTFNGYTSYLDGKLPFDINDFKRDTTSKKNPLSGSQKIEVIASRSDSETLNDSFSGPEFYKPQPLNPMGSINPYSASSITLPLPTGQPEYSSLARPAASNYTAAALSYGGHSSNRYNPMVPNYASDSNYLSNSSNSSYDASMPLMPPPMPPSLSGSSGGSGNAGSNGNSQGDDFNSSWDNGDMSWNALETSNPFNCAGPLSPGRFDREDILDESTTEYDERETDMRPMRDVDHRQLHLPAVPAITNLGPSKDIDHRNLISLTGSPTPRDIEDKYSRTNKTWIAPKDKDFRTPMPVKAPVRAAGDSDYRSLSEKLNPALHPPLKPPPMLTGLLSFSQAQETDGSKAYKPRADNFDAKVDEQGYDPSDMVESIDMDMSDEDLEDIFREVASVENEIDHQTNQNNQEHPSTEEHDNQQQHDEYVPQAPEETLKTVKPIPYRDNLIPVANSRPPLLDTPPNNNNNPWESPQGVQPPNRFPPGFEDHSVQNIGDNGILNTPMRPPINPWKQAPRMPFRIPGPLENHQPPPPGGFHHPAEFQHHQQFQRFPRSPFGQPLRNFGPQNHFRGSPRPQRGNPFFNKSRGRGGGPPGVGPVPRPNVFRGKFRGNPWQ